MMIPIVNRTDKEVVLGLEPEGDNLPLAPGKTVIVKAVGPGADNPQLEIDIEAGLLSISMMCRKEVWCGDVRLK
jgi:hypothetical protein